MLAHHWHVHRLWIGRWIFHLTVRTDDTGSFLFSTLEAIIRGKEAIDSHPVHITVPSHLILAHYGNIVFNVACCNTRAASRATCQIDGHSPSVTYFLYRMLMPKIKGGCWFPILCIDRAVPSDIFMHCKRDQFVP